MHDATVAAKILETVKGHAGLRTVFVSVGRDSCLKPETLARSFDMVKAGTPAEGARLVAVPCPGDGVTVLSVEVGDGSGGDGGD